MGLLLPSDQKDTLPKYGRFQISINDLEPIIIFSIT